MAVLTDTPWPWPTPAGGSKRKGRGISHPCSGAAGGTERAKRSGGLHKRSAEDWGNSLCARAGQSPLSVPWLLLLGERSGGVAGRNRPAEVGGGRRESGCRQGGVKLLPSVLISWSCVIGESRSLEPYDSETPRGAHAKRQSEAFRANQAALAFSRNFAVIGRFSANMGE